VWKKKLRKEKKKIKKEGLESQIKSNYKFHPPTCNELAIHFNYLTISALEKSNHAYHFIALPLLGKCGKKS
jgi:hypothetical protein